MPVRWQCPLAMRTRHYTSKSDVYSFGAFVYEVFSSGGTPYPELQATEVLRAVMAGHRLSSPSASTPPKVVELMRDCTHMDVAGRPSMLMVQMWLTGLCHDMFGGGGGGGGRGEAVRLQRFKRPPASAQPLLELGLAGG